jgi:LysM repeat protein
MKESEGLYRSFRFLKRLLIGIAVSLVGMAILGYTILMRHVDARGAYAAASRELRGGMLHYGEHVDRYVKAFQRNPTDYYRASNGLLVATKDRLIYIGIAPSDNLESEDAPQRIVQYEFPNDTFLTFAAQRLYWLSASGVRISHPGQASTTIAAARGDEEALDSLIYYVNKKISDERAAARRERKLRADVAALINQPIYYTVRRGDALSNVASRFDATPDQIRAWNNIVGDRIKIGQKLIVKPEGPRQKPPPPPPPPPRKPKPAAGTPPSKQ